MYLTLLLVIIAVFSLFRLFYFFHRKLALPIIWKHYLGYLLPVVELISWLGVVIWAIRFVYARQDFIILIVFGCLVLLMIVPVWFLLRDFLFGVILKLQRKIEVNREINVEGLIGSVIKTGYFSFDILTPQGSKDAIPYSRVISKVISHDSDNSNLVKKKLIFTFSSTEFSQVTLTKLQTLLINCPFVASSEPPLIEELVQQNESQKVVVFVYTLKAEHIDKIKAYVAKHFDGLLLS
ncbi:MULTISPECIES: mechanosensitive ion channel domain-containing protein [unclassified Lentimicrobium]|uniref:mechanosensitive ion channel domain-containing protein n=1 Tax=unclassified Lentimicrobium TaxID=2677434 RepID=UPI001554BBC4|nr:MULTISPECIES: mechanosensitive ion channel domain-containing protein [unclassified Lentimicrobium]NPD47463.1 mechanosensitive ion channel [Lentimicrobium sp. S6]NPD86978.1 mechanosensitive ion channel [Lentimicrobium sp. L6]